MQKTALIVLILLSFLYSPTHAQIPAGYYNSTIGLRGDTLKDSLNNIIDGHTEFPYTSSSQMDCWDVIKQADKDPNNSNNVIGVYSGFSMNGPLEYASGSGWSREHVWAKSRGNFGTSRGTGTDLHNLMAEDVSTNSARNNRNFDIGDTRYVDGSGTYSGTTNSFTSAINWVWEPRDEVKGDIARIIFYMDVRYEGEHGEVDLEVVDSLLSNSDQSPIHGNARTLYQWHLMDTVDAAERRRNDTIFKYQGNRNPFVDHPEFVRDIYGARFGNVTILYEATGEELIKIYPNPTKETIKIESKEEIIRELEIYDLQGKLILKQSANSKSIKIDVSQLSKGTYSIRLFDALGNSVSKKYLVQ